jgi:alternate signal-mediated exported protein
MNKMTKGALATGLGVALLVGGGGTLAVWNASDTAPAGTIKSGDLNLTAGKGEWTSLHSAIPIDLATYKVVPGDLLTFTQKVQVNLEGDLMQADLTVTDPGAGFAPLIVSATKLTDDKTNTQVVGPLTPALNAKTEGAYTAKVTVEFPEATDERIATDKTADLGLLAFTLRQLAPAAK